MNSTSILIHEQKTSSHRRVGESFLRLLLTRRIGTVLLAASAALAGCSAAPESEPLTHDAIPEDGERQESGDTANYLADVDTNEAYSSLVCNTPVYWTSTPDSDTDSSGTQYNGTIDTPITVEVRQSGTGLEARVCKPGGIFSSNIAFSIYDGATSSAVDAAVANLATAGKTCSSWVFLSNSNGYSPGQTFGGIWQVVSPASSASNWSFPYSGCSVQGSPGGTCWNGFNITMMRTCKQ